jgi:hypothetical protein
MSGRRVAQGLISASLACLIWTATAGANGLTFYTKAGAGATSCVVAGAVNDPCSLPHAVSLAGDDDSIVVEPGAPYTPGAPVTISNRVDIGGQAGTAVPEIDGTLVVDDAGAKVHDLTITAPSGSDALQLQLGQADRITAVSVSGAGCHLESAVLRDSVCVSTSSSGVKSNSGSAGTHTSEIRNITAFSLNSDGISVSTSVAGVANTIHGINVIASGGSADVFGQNLAGGASTITLASSNYAVVVSNNGASVPLAGVNDNQTAPPLFVSRSSGDLHELAGSPTIDAGVPTADLGPLDLARAPRTAVTCLGGPIGRPDIGAYEFGPPSPPLAACSAFKIGQLALNKKKGTGDLTVTVPGSGSLNASGKGLKGTSTNATAAGEIKLKLKASGKSKRKLADKGKLKLKLQLAWTPTGGTAATQTDKVTLKKK